jgi:hypothetical protein
MTFIRYRCFDDDRPLLYELSGNALRRLFNG